MKTLWISIFWCAAMLLRADTLDDDALKQISFEQKLGDHISLQLPFRDESGRAIQLADYFGHHPVVMVLGYYGCPMLCSAVLNGLTGSLQDLTLKMGQDYEVIYISIDPKEPTSLAAAKKASYVERFGRPGAATGWHFLTGKPAAIHQITGEVGFHYAYDDHTHEYAHASGLVFLTPEGKISKYLPGVAFSSADVGNALVAAAKNETGSRMEQLFLLCFHYSPFTGKYSAIILTAVRVFSALVFVALTWWIVRHLRQGHTLKGA